MATAISPAINKRTRVSTPRTKSGCTTCRIRHVKCDEAKPFCLKCVKAGRECDGYSPEKLTRGVKSGPSPKPTASGALSTLSIASYALPFRIPGGQRDRQLLHYFCVQGASDVSGFLVSNFWSSIVLQRSHHEPMVRQALVALSSLHLEYVTADSTGSEVATEKTLHQYGKALRALQTHLESDHQERSKVALVCCIIFYCFESTLGNHKAAMDHLRNGLMILASYQREHPQKSRSNDADIENLSKVLARFDMQATFFDDSRAPLLMLAPLEERKSGLADLKGETPFAGLEEAQLTLNKLLNWLFHFLQQHISHAGTPKDYLPPAISEEKSQLVRGYAQWLTKVTSLETSLQQDSLTRPSDNLDQLCGIQTLLILHRVTYMLLASKLPDDPTVFDCSPNAAAEEVLARAEDVLRFTEVKNASAGATKTPRRNCSSETGIVAPLFLLAIKCGDETVCRRAGDLLARARRREGLFDAKTMADTVQQLLKIKEYRKSITDVEGGPNSSLECWTSDIIENATSGVDEIKDLADRSVLVIQGASNGQ